MRRHETVILNRTVMPDMVPAPQDNIVTDRYEWLHNIVFKYKTVLTQIHVSPDEGSGADIAGG